MEQLVKLLRDGLVESKVGGGKFPDFYISLNRDNPDFAGGEMVEIKDAKSGYSTSSFNSTLPSSTKFSRNHMREVYYLIRGRKQKHVKICFVHGSFFETIPAAEAIKDSLAQVFREVLSNNSASSDSEAQQAAEKILAYEWKRENLSRVRKPQGAAITLRFRVMAEAMPEANLLNAKHYSVIKDDTLNMIVPANENAAQPAPRTLLEKAFANGGKPLPADFTVFEFPHKISGRTFIAFQVPL